MVRPGPPHDELVVVLRATPGALDEALGNITDVALQSAAVYVIEEGVIEEGGSRHVLFGVSVFAVLMGAPRSTPSSASMPRRPTSRPRSGHCARPGSV